MAAYDFPNSPTNGQIVTTSDGISRQYDSTTNTWSVVATNITGNTGSSGVISVQGPINNTGTSTAAILGIAGGTSGQLLTSNGTSQATFQDAPVSLPSQTGNSGKLLTTNGTVASWGTSITDLSVTNTITGSISGNAGTVTNGVYTTGSYTNPSWLTISSISGALAVTGQVVDHKTFSQKTASYTLVLSDDGDIIETNIATANTITIPLNSAQAFPIGSQITIVQTGVGQTTITPTAIVTGTYSSGGALGATTFVLTSATGVLPGQLVTGTGIADNTYVVSVATNTVTISQATIAQVAGSIIFSIPVFGTPGLSLRGQWSSATLMKRTADSRTSTNYANDTWIVMGDLA